MQTEITSKILSLVLYCFKFCQKIKNRAEKENERKLKEIIKNPFSKWKNKNFMLIYILSLILLRCYVFSSSLPFASLCVRTLFPLTHVPSALVSFFLFFLFHSNTGFLCLVIYRRDTHVVELQIGNLTSRLEDACAPDQYDVSRTPFTTLLGRMRIHFSNLANQTLKQNKTMQRKKKFSPATRHESIEREKNICGVFAGDGGKTFE